MTQTLTQTELHRPASLVEVFQSAWLFDSHLSREGWRYLWQRYDRRKLIDIGRRSGWFATEDDAEAQRQLIEWSLKAGYDPVADQFGAFDPASGLFDPEDTG